MEITPEKYTELVKNIDTINQRIWQIRGVVDTNYDVFAKGNDALEKAKLINYSYGIAQCLLNKGMGYFVVKNDTSASFKYINEAFEIFKKLDDKKWIANTHLTLAIIYNTIANPELALYNGLRGITYYDTNEEDGLDKIMGYYILGTIYKDLKKYDEAEKYYQIGISFSSDKTNMWLGRIYSSLANIYSHQAKYDKAINLSLESLKILQDDKNSLGESRALTDIGILHRKQLNYKSSLKYLYEGLKIRQSQNLNQFVLTSLIEIATTYSESKDYNAAIDYFSQSEVIALNLSIESKLITIYQEMAVAYKAISNFSSAVSCYEKLFKISSVLHKKQLDIKISNVSNELIIEKEAEIERLKNVELKAAYDLIEEKNKEILESMRYASRIQKALLPNDKYLEKNIRKEKKT